jgi:hypothetical protein
MKDVAKKLQEHAAKPAGEAHKGSAQRRQN